MGMGVRTPRDSPASWDASADVDAFVDEVLMELAATEGDGTKPTRSGLKLALSGAACTRRSESLLLRHPIACHRPALRYPVQHAAHPVIPVGPGLAIGATCLTGCAALAD